MLQILRWECTTLLLTKLGPGQALPAGVAQLPAPLHTSQPPGGAPAAHELALARLCGPQRPGNAACQRLPRYCLTTWSTTLYPGQALLLVVVFGARQQTLNMRLWEEVNLQNFKGGL